MNKSPAILLAILAAALALRLWGIGFGLPDSYHADEERIVHHALAFGLGDLNPHYFNYPSFPMYLLFFEYGAYFLLGRLLGWFASPADFQRLFFSDSTPFYLIGRATTALLGAATVFLTYRFGRKAYGRAVGILAALFLAVNFLHADSSHYITTDVLLTFFIAASYIQIVRIFQSGAPGAYSAAGLLAGLGAASKYNAATLALPILLAHCWGPFSARNWAKRFLDGRLWLAGGCMLLAFIAASPYCLLDFAKFWEDFRGISEHMRIGVYGTGGGPQFRPYFLALSLDRIYFAPWRWTTLGAVYLVGMAWGILRGGRKGWLILVYPVGYFLLIASWGVCNPRYLLPIFPGLCVLSGAALSLAWTRLSRRRFGAIVGAGVLAALLAAPVRNLILNDRMLSRTDTRTEARVWIESNLPAGSGIALEWDNNGTVQLQESEEAIRAKVAAYREGKAFTIHHPAGQMAQVHEMRLQAKKGPAYRIVRIGEVDGLSLVPRLYDLAAIRAEGAEYLVASSLIYNWFVGAKAREKYPVHAAFYDRLFRQKPLKEFVPKDQPGPIIKIYDLKKLEPPARKQISTD